MSTSGQDPSGGERDPPQMLRKKRGPTTGVVSARARVGTPGANTVRYDQTAQAFYLMSGATGYPVRRCRT